jgi:hypothetical protein
MACCNDRIFAICVRYPRNPDPGLWKKIPVTGS